MANHSLRRLTRDAIALRQRALKTALAAAEHGASDPSDIMRGFRRSYVSEHLHALADHIDQAEGDLWADKALAAATLASLKKRVVFEALGGEDEHRFPESVVLWMPDPAEPNELVLGGKGIAFTSNAVMTAGHCLGAAAISSGVDAGSEIAPRAGVSVRTGLSQTIDVGQLTVLFTSLFPGGSPPFPGFASTEAIDKARQAVIVSYDFESGRRKRFDVNIQPKKDSIVVVDATSVPGVDSSHDEFGQRDSGSPLYVDDNGLKLAGLLVRGLDGLTTIHVECVRVDSLPVAH